MMKRWIVASWTMEQIKIREFEYAKEQGYYNCYISNPVGGPRLPIIRANKDTVLVDQYFVKWFARFMQKLNLGENDRILRSIIKNRTLVQYQISTSYTYIKVGCTDPDVGLAYYMGHKKGIRYFSREESKVRRSSQVRRKKETKD